MQPPLVRRRLYHIANLAVFAGACLSMPKSPTAVEVDDIVITSAQFGSTVGIRVGQTIALRRPGDSGEWQVDYADSVLQMLTPADRSRTPGPEGWRFKAIGVGETDLALSLILQVDPGSPPPPAPPRLVVTIRVQR